MVLDLTTELHFRQRTNKFVQSFFGRIYSAKMPICLRFCLTFRVILPATNDFLNLHTLNDIAILNLKPFQNVIFQFLYRRYLQENQLTCMNFCHYSLLFLLNTMLLLISNEEKCKKRVQIVHTNLQYKPVYICAIHR